MNSTKAHENSLPVTSMTMKCVESRAPVSDLRKSPNKTRPPGSLRAGHKMRRLATLNGYAFAQPAVAGFTHRLRLAVHRSSESKPPTLRSGLARCSTVAAVAMHPPRHRSRLQSAFRGVCGLRLVWIWLPEIPEIPEIPTRPNFRYFRYFR